MGRVIFHVDANCFYASVECLYHPELRGKPVAVCGDPEARHGIVLTATYPAKRLGVHVGMAVWQAQQLCPKLICVPPDYELYLHFSQLIRAICREYASRVEGFGLDECWLDVSADDMDILRGGALADVLRTRIKQEVGVTVSIGVADNKVFAKLGSDLRKPDGTTVITPTSFKRQIWGLPASDLLYVGPATTKRLRGLGILTIGDLACADATVLKRALGKNGLLLRTFALGLDSSAVMESEAFVPAKSIGNSTTTPHDIKTLQDAKCVYYLLSESVAARMREQGVRAQCLSISVRTTDLSWRSCQTLLNTPTYVTNEIAVPAFLMFRKNFSQLLPLRSVGLHCSRFSGVDEPRQLILNEEDVHTRHETLDHTIDDLRRRYGHNIVQRGVVLADKTFSALKPKEDNTIHPNPFIRR